MAIMGESGSGKTTLLNILATLDKPTAGEVLLSGVDMGSIPEKQLAMYRRNNLGFVFQDFNLLDTFSLKDNIMLPLVLSGKTYSEMALKMMELSRRLSIEKLLEKYPYEVSGGEMLIFLAHRETVPFIVMQHTPVRERRQKTIEIMPVFIANGRSHD